MRGGTASSADKMPGIISISAPIMRAVRGVRSRMRCIRAKISKYNHKKPLKNRSPPDGSQPFESLIFLIGSGGYWHRFQLVVKLTMLVDELGWVQPMIRAWHS